MTNEAGEPLDSEKHYLGPGDDVRLKACRLVRHRRTGSGPRGFNDKINYPKAWRKKFEYAEARL